VISIAWERSAFVYNLPMPNVESIAPTLFVEELNRSIEWYVRVLGFAVNFQAADYAGVKLGPAQIMLVQVGPAAAGVSYRGACHLRIGSGIDDYVAQIEATGETLAATLKDRPEYGMREAAVRDPDGHDIYIGQEL
jgi:catechol 2,3-dioxygenase-like lactoylglutathione lyase family enzyme